MCAGFVGWGQLSVQGQLGAQARAEQLLAFCSRVSREKASAGAPLCACGPAVARQPLECLLSKPAGPPPTHPHPPPPTHTPQPPPPNPPVAILAGAYDWKYLCTPQWPWCQSGSGKRKPPRFFDKDAFLGFATALVSKARRRELSLKGCALAACACSQISPSCFK